MTIPVALKVYHILHVDRLRSVMSDGGLWCDAVIAGRTSTGTVIGMNKIKQRRLNELTLSSHPDLYVGSCVPFYFCPRSIMLYLIHKANHLELSYRGGQGPIVHLEFDLKEVAAWADNNNQRWAFTLSNAGSRFFEDRCNLTQLNEIDWEAVKAHSWQDCQEEKQAEFLVESRVPWQLVERVGVGKESTYQLAANALTDAPHKPRLEVMEKWYY